MPKHGFKDRTVPEHGLRNQNSSYWEAGVPKPRFRNRCAKAGEGVLVQYRLR